MTIEIRPVSGYAELERWVATRNEVAPEDPEDPGMMALVRASELGHVTLLAYENGEVVGTGRLAADPSSLEASHPYAEVMVPERHRGRGVGTALLRELSERARRLGKEGLHVDALEQDAYSLDFLRRRGFVEGDRADQLVLGLAGTESREAAPPAGVSLVWLADRPDLVQAMYEVAAQTYPELGGPISKQAASLHEWQLYELGDPQIALELTAIALAGEEVVGFATLKRIRGGEIGVHWITVVLPAWRRRGIGAALTLRQIAATRLGSFARLQALAWTEPQRRLFESLGYERRGASIDFFGPLL